MSKLSRRLLNRVAAAPSAGAFVLGTRPLARVARQVADPYLGGETLEEALSTMERLHQDGFATAIDVFGEAVTDPTRVERAVTYYLQVNHELADIRPPVNVWVDLSNLGLDVSPELCLRSVERIVQTLPPGALLQVRAHDSSRTQRIIETVLQLKQRGAPVMATLPANLRRSHPDARELAAASVPVLLVKGASVEPPTAAYAWGEQTDLAFIRLAHQLHADGARFVLGTHDPLIREALKQCFGEIAVEMLLGVRTADALELVRTGHRVRIYVPFGSDWFRYWVRRLAEARGA
jgi:proline dehydrogenase